MVSTFNRMARGMDYPSMVGPGATESLVGELEAPGTKYQANQDANGGMTGLGDVIADITSGNWTQLPTDFVTGLNPATFDVGSYAIVAILGVFLYNWDLQRKVDAYAKGTGWKKVRGGYVK